MIKDIRQERGYARSVVRAPASRFGGVVAAPSPGGAADVFHVATEELAIEERVQSGWCVRLAASAPPAYDMTGLLLELRVVTGGAEHMLELDAGRSSSIHIAAEYLAARLRWTGDEPLDARLTWQVARGYCETTASRTFVAPGYETVYTGAVPPFARDWSLYSGEYDVTANAERVGALGWLAGEDARIHAVQSDEMLAAIGGAPRRVPPGALAWEWFVGANPYQFRLAFWYGGIE